MFVRANDPVYEGMIVGIHSRDNDLVVNATRTKQLTNFRVSGKEDAIKITPPIELTLEYGVEFIEDDELVEITPKVISTAQAPPQGARAQARLMWSTDMYAGQLDQGTSVIGTLLALGVPVSGAANWTITQHSHAQGHDVDLMPAVLIGAVLSALITLPLAWPFQASAHDMRLLLGLGLVQLAIPCVLVVMCAKVLKAPEVALLGLLEVIFGILLAWVGAGEVPGRDVLVGGSLVIGALVANEWVGWRDRA
jgi:hypothetical protein